MFRRVFCKKHVIWSGIIPVINVNEKKFENYQEVRGAHLESGWERVKIIFKEDSMGAFHPDLQRAVDTAEIGMFFGAFWGGIVGSREHVHRFMNNNDTTLFFNNQDALRQMGRQGLFGTALGAVKTAPVFGAFAGGFVLFTSCVQAYRLKEGFLEYCIGGFLIGSLFRFNYGIRGMLVGGVVASILGGMYGAAEIGLSKLLGKSTTEMKFLLSSYKKEVCDSISANYYATGNTPIYTTSESPESTSHSSGDTQNPSHSSGENRKSENET